MKANDAAVLFWYARNSLFFEQGLQQSKDVILCKYADLVSHPAEVVKKLYERLGQVYPGPSVHKRVHPRSLKRGQALELSPDIDRLASDLLKKLDSIYQVVPLV